MTADDPTSRAKSLILGYLSGAEDPEERPALFDDDLILLAVARLARSDPTWLTHQVGVSNWSEERRRVVGDLQVALSSGQPNRGDRPST